MERQTNDEGGDIRDRSTLIRRTYTHLFVAILIFIAIEAYFFVSGGIYFVTLAMWDSPWLFVMSGFMVLTWLVSHSARKIKYRIVQYGALLGYVLLQSIFFMPLLAAAQEEWSFYVHRDAGLATLLAISTLTALVFYTTKNFSFLGLFLKWAGVCALSLIVLAMMNGFNLGLLFRVGMVCVACAAILYDTSYVLHNCDKRHYVSAASALFSSVALLFWTILLIFVFPRF